MVRFSNDPRGSGSKQVNSDILAELGELHYGRKPLQPAGWKVEEFYETLVDGKKVMSPDHYELRLSNPDGQPPAVNLKRSRGYEGFVAA